MNHFDTVFDSDTGAWKTTERPSLLKMKYDYVDRTDGQAVYVGFAKRGTKDTDATWVVHKFTFDVSNQVTARQVAVNITWNDRTTAGNYD